MYLEITKKKPLTSFIRIEGKGMDVPSEKTTFKQQLRCIYLRLRIWQAILIWVCLVRRRFMKPHPSIWQNDSLQCRTKSMPLLSDCAFVYIRRFIGRSCHKSDVLKEADRSQLIDRQGGKQQINKKNTFSDLKCLKRLPDCSRSSCLREKEGA